MLRLQHKEWVCLVSGKELALRHTELQQRDTGGLLRDTLWRQVELIANASGVELHLLNVDERAARGGYCGGGCNVVEHKLTWDDINDREALMQLFRLEPLCVFQTFEKMVDNLRDHMLPLREALAA